MERRLNLCFVIALLALSYTVPAIAQTATSAPVPDLWSAMPDVDVVASVNTQRIFVEAIPRVLADQPQMSGMYTMMLGAARAQTGIDPQSFSRVIIGVRSTGNSFEQQEVIGVAEGSFKYSNITDAVRGAMKDALINEELYASHSVTTFTPGNSSPATKANTRKGPVRPLALAELTTGMMVFGDARGVHRALDALNSSQPRVSPDLVSAVSGSSDSLISVAVRVPKDLIRKELGDRPNNRLMKLSLSVNLISTRLDLSASGLPFLLAATTDSPEAAGDLRCLMESLRTVLAGALDFYTTPPPSKWVASKARGPNPPPEVLALRVLEGLSITSEGNEMRIQTELPMEMLRSLLKNMALTPAPPPPQRPPEK